MMELDASGKKSLIYECISLGGEEDDTESLAGPIKVSLRSKIILGLLSFFTLNGARPGIFIAPHLLMHGWSEKDIGLVLFIGGITTLLVQTPIGQLIDVVKNKKIFIFTANLLIGLTSIALVYSSNIALVISSLCLQGIGNAMGIPAIYGITLGLVGHEGIVGQVPINETSNHAGNAFYAILAGILAFFTSGDGLFWICAAMGVCGCLILPFIRNREINYERARGLTDIDGNVKLEPVSLSELAYDYRLVILFISVALFHFGNAAMLPLLSQQLSINNEKQGIAFAAACIIVAQVSMVLSAASCYYLIPKIGSKKVFVAGFSFIPIRGAIIVLLLRYYPNPYTLLATQVLDGMAGGIFGVTAVVVAESLTRGSGRFNLVVGVVKCTEALGASFSNLTGEMIAHYSGYEAAFLFLSVLGFLPMILYSIYMPDSSRGEGGNNGSTEIDASRNSAQGDLKIRLDLWKDTKNVMIP